jgi:hypothetical protein
VGNGILLGNESLEGINPGLYSFQQLVKRIINEDMMGINLYFVLPPYEPVPFGRRKKRTTAKGTDGFTSEASANGWRKSNLATLGASVSNYTLASLEIVIIPFVEMTDGLTASDKESSARA